MDRYANFDQLKTFEKDGVDFRVRWRAGCSGIAILSIHGGDIEPGTSLIADAIAGTEHTYYALEGLKPSGNLALHITSTHFDEPVALEIVCQSEIIVTVHGCAESEPVVFVGGRDVELCHRILRSLAAAGFQAIEAAQTRFVGTDLANICNLCGRGMGIQLEISSGLRARMFEPGGGGEPKAAGPLLQRFADAVREALEPFVSATQEWPAVQGGEEL